MSEPGAAPRGEAGSGPLAIRAEGVRKAFGAIEANRGAALEVRAGEIHAVVGENGAGKSTLMRILAGLFPPDAGRVEVMGRDVTGWTTSQAIAAGVGMVHQHFMLVPTLTVAENLVLGREPLRGLTLDRAAAAREVESLCARTGLRVDARRPVATLSVGESQRVEILKVLWRGARILILDEPTAVLSPPEVHELWGVLRRLRAEGDTVVLVTHKLDEVMEISDRVTVMRAGETVGRLATRDASPAQIARIMVGRDVALAAFVDRASVAPVASGAAPVLEVRELSVHTPSRPHAVDRVSLAVSPGSILGIAGVEGNGQSELVAAIAGLVPVRSGSVRIAGADLTGATVRARSEAGLSHIPEDRHHRGLILDYSVAENLILGRQGRFTRRGVIDRDAVARHAAERVAAFDIRPPDPSLPARALSGGNQQKVVVAREMGRDFLVLLAAQPTRGVDVGAIEFIHDRLRAARDAGAAILLVSADLVEVLALADRVAVMYAGRIVVTMPRADASADSLGPWMTGATRGAA